ncbi:MAG: polysaccharide export protein [Bacteroidales bacterium]|nr:polysaccharide export protein [Bacteroidales bacterium]
MTIAAFMAVSCSTPKGITYMQDLGDNTVVAVAAERAIHIRPDDKLTIVVKSKDPALSDLFNLTLNVNRASSEKLATGVSSRNYTSGSESLMSYTVTPEGDIDFPVLGKLHVEGMTRSELSGFIKGELMGRDLVKDPVVTVEFLNTGISVLGEVAEPGRYDMNTDRLNVLQALALAGDLTMSGMRENVLVMREENGKMVSYRLNLTDANQMASSPAFYLQQDDIIYVEPNAIRKRSQTVNGNNVLNASFWISVASLAASVATLIFR